MDRNQVKYKISNATKDRVAACKAYIERKYAKQIQEEMEKKQVWEQLFRNMSELNFSSKEQDIIKKEIMKKEAEQMRKKRQKMTVMDFEPIAIIGRGAFGEVRVCRHKETREIVAIKKMKKADMLLKNQLGHIRAERDILATADTPWIVELKYSFQDEKNLYLVMEFLQGGDLMNLLIKLDILSEEVARFFIAELILAVDAIHQKNFIHRDLKPDNILIDSRGHIKLSDFGLCKQIGMKAKIEQLAKMQEVTSMGSPKGILKNTQNFPQQLTHNRNRQLAYSTVGTPDYIAPEVFTQKGYTELIDWWSVGVILFEMVVGYPPFYSDSPQQTCQKIMNWRKYFRIPSDANLSPQCADLIRRLMNDEGDRLGRNGANEIKKHAFFNGVDWENIRNKPSPLSVDLTSLTKNFDKFEEEEPWYATQEDNKKARGRKSNNGGAYFQGYTFKRDVEKERSPLVRALEELENIKPSNKKPQSPLSTTKSPQFFPYQKSQSPRSRQDEGVMGFLKPREPSNQVFCPIWFGRDNKSNSPIDNRKKDIPTPTRPTTSRPTQQQVKPILLKK